MDNVTHSLFALTLARTPIGRIRGGTATLLLASNAPDIDVVATLGGTPNYLQWHRGPTHGPLGIIGLGLVTAALVWLFLRRSSHHETAPPASLAALVATGTLGVLLHIGMDLPTSYGVRLLSPMDWHWYSTDWMPIVDIYLLVALASCLYFGRGSETARRLNLAIVVALMVVNYGVRAAAHRQALALAPRLFGPTLPQPCPGSPPTGSVVARWPKDIAPQRPAAGNARCLIEIAAVPTFTSPFGWRVIAQMSDAYQLQEVNVLNSRFRAPPTEPEVLWRLSSRYPNQWTAPAVVAASSPIARVFLGFSRFPAVRPAGGRGDALTIQFSDVRFVGGPLRGGGRGGRGRGAGLPARSIFTATVQVTAGGSIVDERLGP